MKGELTFDEDVLIDGTFIGPISNRQQHPSCPSDDGRDEARRPALEIAGTLQGSVSSNSALFLRRSAKLSGSMQAVNVIVEKGTSLDNTVLAGRVTFSPKRRRKRR